MSDRPAHAPLTKAAGLGLTLKLSPADCLMLSVCPTCRGSYLVHFDAPDGTTVRLCECGHESKEQS